ncbi:MAG: 30S ribosomal protein S12 methylthiotransferase RimO [Oligoflexales bacterium]|nr:30S ribosomal protein S12 methylthiotransferase RimO [Oligoflexales bacterium]
MLDKVLSKSEPVLDQINFGLCEDSPSHPHEKVKTKKVHLVSLGCARNLVDSEVMIGTLLNRSWEKTLVPKEADAVIINTCGFIEAAKEESIDTILRFAALKKENPDFHLVVTGCLTQRYKKQLALGLPEVDFFLGTDEFSRIAELLDNPPPHGSVFARRTHYLYNEALPRVNTLSPYSAYVKVAEGCGHSCSFCIIPAIRGKLRSRPISSVVTEVQKLASQGCVEINLIAQDLAAYGRDRGQDELLPLLEQLVLVDGIRWIRMLYVYPENISDELLDFFAHQEKIVKYIDIPVQHASDRILKSMNRALSKSEMKAVIRRVREKVPGVAIRTTVMVGFPGETDADFEDLKEFVTEMQFEHLGCFTYSQEEGTVAGRMKDQVDEKVKLARQASLMMIQKEISAKRMSSFLGQVHQALVLGPSRDNPYVWEARLPTQAPEVDGLIYIHDGAVKAGCIQAIEIQKTSDYDLVGSVH